MQAFGAHGALGDPGALGDRLDIRFLARRFLEGS